MPHALPALPYAYDALEPVIDRRTMEIHHTRHHQAYVDQLNRVLEGSGLEDLPVEMLITGLEALPEPLRSGVRNHGGGHANHALYWTILSAEGGVPEGTLAAAIERDLGGLSAFQERFTQAAQTRFGSGWAWLSVGRDGRLLIESSANQDSPLMGAAVGLSGGTPILTLDVWEHAYYLHYQNRRPDYVAAFFGVIDWREVARRYEATLD